MLFITTRSRPIYNRYVLSLAHTDYTLTVGGVEKLIKGHQNLLRENQISYVFLCPLKPDENNYDGIYKMYIDGKYQGAFRILPLLKFISGWESHLSGVHIHHIWHWDLNDVVTLLSALNCRILFFLHDYYLICNHYNLINSEGEYCGTGPVSREKCKLCRYYQEEYVNFQSRRGLMTLMEENQTVFIAPSAFVKQLWCETFPQFQRNTKVIEHLVLSGIQQLRKAHPAPYRIAYVGAQYQIKGWPIFVKMEEKLRNDPRYEFFYFGVGEEKKSYIQNIPVSYQTDGDQAMQNKLKEYGIDFAIFFSQWPETYNFTCYEAYLAGSLIVTNEISGNIQAMTKCYHCGIVVQNEQELFEWFSSGSAIGFLMDYIQDADSTVPKHCDLNTAILNENEMDSNGTSRLKKKKRVIFEPREAVVLQTKRYIKAMLE